MRGEGRGRESERRASAQLWVGTFRWLTCGWWRDCWRCGWRALLEDKARRLLGWSILLLTNVPAKTIQSVPHIIRRGENCQRRRRILFLWEAEGSVWKTSLSPHTSSHCLEAPERGWEVVVWQVVTPSAVALECEETSLALGSAPSHKEEAQMVPPKRRGNKPQNVSRGKALELREASCCVEG